MSHLLSMSNWKLHGSVAFGDNGLLFSIAIFKLVFDLCKWELEHDWLAGTESVISLGAI